MRYIDADQLRKDEIARCHCVPHIGSGDNNYKDLDEVLNDAPAADVVEVRRGEWRIVDSDIGYVEMECSLCKNKFLFNTDDGFTYCPNCGAKMDGEK